MESNGLSPEEAAARADFLGSMESEADMIICPRCGSGDAVPLKVAGEDNVTEWRCSHCGQHFQPGEELDVETFAQKMAREQKEREQRALEASTRGGPAMTMGEVVDAEGGLPVSEEIQKAQETVAPVNKFEGQISEENWWEDSVAIGIDLREEMDERRWDMGALVNYVCPSRKSGRPREDAAQVRTLTEFAKEIGEDRSTLSQLASNDEFYTEEMRAELPPQLSWRELAKARTRSGWRRGQKVAEEHRQEAFKVILEMAEGGEIEPAKRTKPSKPFKWYVTRIEDLAQKAMVNCAEEIGGTDYFTLLSSIQGKAADALDMIRDAELEDDEGDSDSDAI